MDETLGYVLRFESHIVKQEKIHVGSETLTGCLHQLFSDLPLGNRLNGGIALYLIEHFGAVASASRYPSPCTVVADYIFEIRQARAREPKATHSEVPAVGT